MLKTIDVTFLPVEVVVMCLYNTGQPCHLQHAVVARNCYGPRLRPLRTPHCYVGCGNQRLCSNHHDTEINKSSINDKITEIAENY